MVSLALVVMASRTRIDTARALVETLTSQAHELRDGGDYPVGLPILSVDDRNPCQGAALAWAVAEDVEASHVLVVQEDVVPCRNFLRAARGAVVARPTEALSFFTPDHVGRAPGPRWYRPFHFSHSQAVCLPRLVAVGASAFLASSPGVHDDEALAGFLATRNGVVVTVPNLVQHAAIPSTMGHRLRLSSCAVGPEDEAPTIWPLF